MIDTQAIKYKATVYLLVSRDTLTTPHIHGHITIIDIFLQYRLITLVKTNYVYKVKRLLERLTAGVDSQLPK